MSFDLQFRDVLTHVATLYRLGVVVPFIGSGLSRPACRGWFDFLTRLAGEAGVAVPEAAGSPGARAEAPALYRLADQTVSALRALPNDECALRYRNALRGWEGERPEIPPQTKALARLFWPLVLTTNYDDLFWSATEPAARPSVLGRSLEDCHRVLRSLDETTPPILWALQGFLGGQAGPPEDVVEDAARRRSLLAQLVVGHHQYQRAINSEGHFRRAFAEVFRRRSLLFLGSGILEDYLVNLFSEIIHHHGAGAYPHFALVRAQERERFHASFLQTRLGIVPVFYERHEQLPQYLRELAGLIEFWPRRRPPEPAPAAESVRFSEIGVVLTPPAGDAGHPLKVYLRQAEVPPPDPARQECSVVSLGRRRDNRPIEGSQAQALLAGAEAAGLVEDAMADRWQALDEGPSYVYRYGDAPIFGVAARRRDLHEHDRRDLGIIPEAVCAALERVDAAGFEAVNLGAIASGKRRLWHPIHPFAQALRGVRRFFKGGALRHVRQVNVHVVDPAVWYPVVGRKIPVIELLSSGLSTHKIELRDGNDNSESFSVTLRESPTLAELLRQCDIDHRSWAVKIFPEPNDERHDEDIPDDMVIAPTMTVSLSPRPPRPGGHNPNIGGA